MLIQRQAAGDSAAGSRSSRPPSSPRWGLWRWHYRPDPPRLLETVAFDRDGIGETGDRDAMHVSWVSGVPYAYALLRHGQRVGNDDVRRGGHVRPRPRRRQPDARRHLLGPVDRDPRLDVGLASRPLPPPRANARRRDAVPAPRERACVETTQAVVDRGGRGQSGRRPAHAARRRRATRRPPRRDRRGGVLGGDCRDGLDPGARRGRAPRRRAARRRVLRRASRRGTAPPRTSTSRRRRRTATWP